LFAHAQSIAEALKKLKLGR